MWVRVETSRVGPARLPSAASWRGSSSFAYRIHWRSGRSRGDDAHLSENAREFIWGERVIKDRPKLLLKRNASEGILFQMLLSLSGPGCDAANPRIVTESIFSAFSASRFTGELSL